MNTPRTDIIYFNTVQLITLYVERKHIINKDSSSIKPTIIINIIRL